MADDTIHAEIDEQTRIIEQAYMSSDVETILTLFTNDAHMLEPGLDLAGDALREHLRSAFGSDDFRMTRMEIRSRERWIYGDVVFEMGSYDETVVIGGATTEISGNHFLRWERGADGTWRLSRLVLGPDPSAQSAN